MSEREADFGFQESEEEVEIRESQQLSAYSLVVGGEFKTVCFDTTAHDLVECEIDALNEWDLPDEYAPKDPNHEPMRLKMHAGVEAIRYKGAVIGYTSEGDRLRQIIEEEKPKSSKDYSSTQAFWLDLEDQSKQTTEAEPDLFDKNE